MFQLPRVTLSTLPAVISVGAALCLASCAVPGSVSTADSSSSTSAAYPTTRGAATAYSVRQKYGGSSFRQAANTSGVEETTRENFFAWLFATEGGTPKKKTPAATKPAGPVIPAVKVNSGVLARSNSANTRIVIDVARQKAFLLIGGEVAIETPVSTARSGKYTPRGSFRVTERVRSGKISTIYGVGMPYWMRLSGSVYGVHAGYLPGYPASAGCVRLPREAAQLIYDNTKHGTSVTIYSSWSGA